jgi:hypothetical protein
MAGKLHWLGARIRRRPTARGSAAPVTHGGRTRVAD